jgi:(1->4)-alpha-D-glucan 1-alpha-D-glucosylmutase
MRAPRRVPRATYRLQLHREFPFSAARAVLPYLHDMGISDLYLSPISLARPGSVHGYDVVNHERLNPELGSPQDLHALLDDVAALGMGVLIDIVPNHTCIGSPANRRWNEVLEDGPAAASAAYFDIDWNPPKQELRGKVLLPFLADQYGRVLENGLSIVFVEGAFSLCWDGWDLPLAPETWVQILAPAIATMARTSPRDDPALLELESIHRSLTYTLPALRAPGLEAARRHEKQATRRRLAELAANNAAAVDAILSAVAQINGTRGVPESFDALERILNAQYYRLADWRVAAHEINYRRFFDINELAAVRVENPAVFDVVHRLPLSLATHPAFLGFRIDHLDGLADPQQYLDDLDAAWRKQTRSPSDVPDTPYVVVEKILARGESLRSDFAADGTTGYDFMAIAAGLLVHSDGVRLRLASAELAGPLVPFADVAVGSKRLLLESTLAAELTMLARRLDRISEQHRYSRDFTHSQLHEALAEVIASFPVYRTYVRETETDVSSADARAIHAAITAARRRSSLINASLFDFIESVLMHQDPPGLGKPQIEARREFITRLQQLTSPVYAKGIEDTAFYRYLPLIALNEVGGDPSRWQSSDADLHAALARRLRETPHTLSASATHDTKRGEDARARLYVLSEIPTEWTHVCQRWAEMNRGYKQVVDDLPAPDVTEEYLLYQSLVGAWPMQAGEEPDFRQRMSAFMSKARHEAKLLTSYINPNRAYEQAAEAFLAAVLDPARNRVFLEDVEAFVAGIRTAGVCNSLAQLVVKLAAPGVPDFFQGREVWDLSLVDPDNRRAVDFAAHRKLLDEVTAEIEQRGHGAISAWFAHPADGRIKLWVTAAGLRLRKSRPSLFARGGYQPLAGRGPAADHVFGFARLEGSDAVLALVGRHHALRGGDSQTSKVWRDTQMLLPPEIGTGKFRDVFTGASLTTDDGSAPLEEIFATLPVALLERST